MKKYSYFLKAQGYIISLLCILLLSCTSTNVKSSKTIKRDPSIKSGVLNNGITYYVQNNSKPANRIELRLVVKTGSANEDEDQQGVAHFIEHLAFNGTEHFEKNSLIKYFETIGMDFGADMNAYTSFDETVYNLAVPADKPEYLEQALLILHDWSSCITFDEEEIEKERGVVTEEWRGRQGVANRFMQKKLPVLCEDSVYSQRLPIGKMDVIKNVSRERILDYYNKWYRPELISVAIVGAAKPEYLIQKIKEAFEDIPESETKINPSVYNVPEVQGKHSIYFADKEEPFTEIVIAGQTYNHVILTEEDFKHNVAFNMLGTICAFRFDKIIMDPSSPWKQASVTNMGIVSSCDNYGFHLLPKEGREAEAFKLLLDEYDRLSLYGVSDEEINNALSFRLNKAKQYLESEQNHYSSYLVDDLVDSILTGSVDYSAKEYYALMQKIAKTIDKAYMQQIIYEYFVDRGNYLMVLNPLDKQNISEQEAYKIWTEYKNDNLTPYEDEAVETVLMERPSVSGTIASKKYNKNTDSTEYVLSNGIHIIVKKTDYTKNYFIFNAISKGGINYISDEDYPSSILSGQLAVYSGIGNLDYTGLQKYLSSTDFKLGFSTNQMSEVFYGSCHNDKTNMESLLQLTYLFMNEPKFDDNVWSFLDQNYRSQAEAFGTTPEQLFSKKVNDTVYGDIRHASFDKDLYSKVNKDAVIRAYKERYCNPGDYEYYFVGDIDENTLLSLCSVYLGSIDTSNTVHEDFKEINYSFREGITENTVAKGLENKGRVNIQLARETKGFTIEEVYEQDLLAAALNSVLDTRLREVLREDVGGTYSVDVSSYFYGLHDQMFRVSISFGCENEREKELTELTLKELDSIIENGIDQSYIDNFKESWKRNREGNLKSNSFWADTLSKNYFYGIESPYLTMDKKLDKLVTAEAVQQIAKDYIHTDNYIVTYLVSENFNK